MKTLIVFEWKKIIQRKLNLVAMIVGYVLIGICLFCYISQQSFYDETTDTYITGVKAYHENRIKNESMTDYLTEEYVSDIIAQIQYENMDLESDEGYTEVIRPIGSLFYLLGEHYQSGQEFGKLNCLNEMKISKGAKFYERRMEKISEILNMDYSFGNYSGEEKAFWIKKALKVKMPFAWGDSENMYTVWMIIQISFYLLFVIMICVSPLFASEYESGAVALFNSYQIGTIVISYLGMIIIVYTIVAIFSLCGIKNGFAKHQVSN